MSELNTSALAGKTVEEVIDENHFGNLSKLVLITVPAVAVAVAFVYVVINGGNYDSLLNALFIIGGGVLAGGTASATNYLGKSQTQLDLQAARAANTVPVETASGTVVGSLPADSSLVHGNWQNNIEQKEGLQITVKSPEPTVSAPSLAQVEPAPVDDSITPAGS